MKVFSKQINETFQAMQETGRLYKADISGEELWDIYLNSFSSETNPVFRDPSSSMKNCKHCNNFIRRYGNIVTIDSDYRVRSIFDPTGDTPFENEYRKVASNLGKAVRGAGIKDIFVETLSELTELPYEKLKRGQEKFKLGFESNVKCYNEVEANAYGGNIVKKDELRTFHHFHLTLDTKFVDKTGKSLATILNDSRSSQESFYKGMEEIPLDTLKLVRDLVHQGSIMNAESQLPKLKELIAKKVEYDKIDSEKKSNWCWVESRDFIYSNFRGELLGVLCQDIVKGKDLELCCKLWNQRVDPANWMNATAPFTENQKKKTMKVVEEGGYTKSFERRLTTIDDIRASEILHINADGGTETKNVSMFDKVVVTKAHKSSMNFDKVEEVSIDTFMNKILPESTKLEVYLKNSLENNMMTLTTAVDPESKPIFKYGNNYSRTYKGNLSGKSEIKEAVKSKGGNVEGVLRASISWSELGNGDDSDLDIHCIEPNGNQIYFGEMRSRITGGHLDIDIRQPSRQRSPEDKVVVENIYYPNLSKMIPGVYKFYCDQFANRRSKGFVGEVEFNGNIYNYVYDRAVNGKILMCEVTLSKSGELSIEHKLPVTESETTPKVIYGLESNNFHKVELVCLSPNHWNGQELGNKQYLFLLENCKTDEDVKGFHVEDLVPELYPERRVLDALGNANMIPFVEGQPQLSGLGFNATVRNEVVIKVTGSHTRLMKIKF